MQDYVGFVVISQEGVLLLQDTISTMFRLCIQVHRCFDPAFPRCVGAKNLNP